MNPKLLKFLETLQQATEGGAVQPQELIKISDTILSIVKSQGEKLEKSINDVDSDKESKINSLKADLDTQEYKLNKAIEAVKTSSDKTLEKKIKALSKEIENVMLSIPEATDLTELEAKIEAVRKEIPTIPEIKEKGATEIRDMLETLEEDERLDAKAIKNLPEGVKEIVRMVGGNVEVYSGNNKIGSSQRLRFTGATITTDADGAIKVTITGGGGSSTFLDLTDTPSSYTGEALKVLRVNAGETGLEFVTLAGGGDALTTDPLSQFAATTSAQLAGVISDETGSGALVFADTPTFTTRINVPDIRANGSGGFLLEASNGTDIGQLGAGNTANVTWYGSHNFDTVTASRVAQFGASKTLESSSVTTTELGYLSGVTSAIQTQLDAKVSKVGTPVNNQIGVWTGDGTIEGDAALTFDTTTDTLSTVDVSLSNDLLLADGSIINWGSGNATITHAFSGGNIMTFAGMSGITSTADITVPDEAYGSGWNGSLEVPTKNAIYDKIETIGVPTTITVADEPTDTTCFPLFVTNATGDLAPKTNSNFAFNATSGLLTIGRLTVTSNNFTIGSSLPFSDSAGTLTLQNIDALDATTEATIEAAIDTLANLTSASSLATVGTLTGGATGAGFTIALGASTITGDLPFANLTQIAGFSILAKATTGTGDVAALTAGTDSVLRRSGSGDLAFGTIVTNNITDNAVTYAKLQQASAGYKMLVNNTASAADFAETTYRSPGIQTLTATLTWTAGAAPSGATNHSYSWEVVGNFCFWVINLDFATDGTTITNVVVDKPSDMPNPVEPTAFTAGSDRLYMFTSQFASSRSGTGLTFNGGGTLRRNSGDTAYEFNQNITSGTYSQVWMRGYYPVA